MAQAALVHGPGGKSYLLCSFLTTNFTSLSAIQFFGPSSYPSLPIDSEATGLWPADSDYRTNAVTIPATQFTNGVAVINNAQLPAYAGSPLYYLFPQVPGGVLGSLTVASSSPYYYRNVPFIDGTEQMKQNVSYLLRAASYAPFGRLITSDELICIRSYVQQHQLVV